MHAIEQIVRAVLLVGALVLIMLVVAGLIMVVLNLATGIDEKIHK